MLTLRKGENIENIAIIKGDTINDGKILGVDTSKLQVPPEKQRIALIEALSIAKSQKPELFADNFMNPDIELNSNLVAWVEMLTKLPDDHNEEMLYGFCL